MHVVVFDKHQMALQIAIFAQVNDMLNVALAIVIPRMGFAGEDKLNRPSLITGQFDDILKLLKNERSSFVGGKAARKPNGQGIRIEQRIEGDEITLGQP